MQVPKGFDSWSDKCKKGIVKLKKEWKAREAATDRVAAAMAAAAAVDVERDKIAAEDAVTVAALEAHAAWLTGYAAARKAKKADRNAREEQRHRDLEALAGVLLDRYVEGDLTEAEAREEYQQAKEAADAEIEGLDLACQELKRQRDEKKASKADLEKQKQNRQALRDTLKKAAKSARRKAKEARAALDDLRSEKAIIADYLELLRKCEAKSRDAGEAATPVTVGSGDGAAEEGGEGERSRWDQVLWQSLLELPQASVDEAPPPVVFSRRRPE